jgi:hypothetical protein
MTVRGSQADVKVSMVISTKVKRLVVVQPTYHSQVLHYAFVLNVQLLYGNIYNGRGVIKN